MTDDLVRLVAAHVHRALCSCVEDAWDTLIPELTSEELCAIARAIIPIVLEHAAERAVKAYTAGEYEGEAWDCFGSAEFAIAAAILKEQNKPNDDLIAARMEAGMSELKPCPFCGGDAKITRAHQIWMSPKFEQPQGDDAWSWTLHHNCDGNTDITWAFQPKAKLVAAWNRRAPHD